MTNATKPENRIDHIELTTLDMAATRRFCAAAFGWNFTDYDAGYSSFSDGRLDGGFTLDGPPPARGVLIVIYARDLKAIQSKIREAGGRVVKKTFSYPGGSRFHFSDPSGNELAVWSGLG